MDLCSVSALIMATSLQSRAQPDVSVVPLSMFGAAHIAGGTMTISRDACACEQGCSSRASRPQALPCLLLNAEFVFLMQLSHKRRLWSNHPRTCQVSKFVSLLTKPPTWSKIPAICTEPLNIDRACAVHMINYLSCFHEEFGL